MAESVSARLQAWWSDVPCVTRQIFYFLPVITALNYLFGLAAYLVNTLDATLYALQVYRLASTAVVTVDAVDMIFQIFMFLLTCYRAERRKGSIRYIIYLLVSTIIVQAAFDLIMLVLSHLPSLELYRYYPCYGLWPIIVCEICIYCWTRPDDVIHPCGLPIELKSKYYPLILVGLFALITMSAVWELTLGLGLGYLRRG